MNYFYVTRKEGDDFVAVLALSEIRAKLATGELKDSFFVAESDGRSFAQFRKGGTGQWRTLAALLAEQPIVAESNPDKPKDNPPVHTPADSALPKVFGFVLAVALLVVVFHQVPASSRWFRQMGGRVTGATEKIDKAADESKRFFKQRQDEFASGKIEEANRRIEEIRRTPDDPRYNTAAFSRLLDQARTEIKVAQITIEILFATMLVAVLAIPIRLLTKKARREVQTGSPEQHPEGEPK